MNLIQAYAQLLENSLDEAPLSLPEEFFQFTEEEFPNADRQSKRTAKRCLPPTWKTKTQYSDIGSVRLEILDKMKSYILEKRPKRMLLIRAQAGTGKTYAGVTTSHWVSGQLNKRVLYAGPRHDFFEDILKASQALDFRPLEWKEWLPRQNNMPEPEQDTCRYATACNTFSRKGYPAEKFCRDVCGTIYIRNNCGYHRQKDTLSPLLFVQHQHVTSGHPLASEAKVLIGDENPMNAFINHIKIRADEMHWKNLDYVKDELAEVVFNMISLANKGANLSGYPLMMELDMDMVLRATEVFTKERIAKLRIPRVRHPEDVDDLDYNILPILIPLLHQEAVAAIEQRKRGVRFSPTEEIATEYNERIYIREGKLELLSRKSVAKEIPNHIIWFDATGDPEVYAQLFDMEVEVFDPYLSLMGKIIQVVDRTNSKTSLYTEEDVEEEDGKVTKKMKYKDRAYQLRAQIEKIIETGGYRNPAIIVPKKLKSFVNGNGHFYGNRGTNAYNDCDVIIIAGTPNVPLSQIETLAKCIWNDEMKRFDNRWILRDRQYNYVDPEDGLGWEIPVNEYADSRLTALLWQQREAELIQSAHRARILFRPDVTVYLLTSLPVRELPPNQIMSIRQLMDAPSKVNIFKWREFVDYLEETVGEDESITIKEIVEELGIDAKTAATYLEHLEESGKWLRASFKSGGRGRPARAIKRA